MSLPPARVHALARGAPNQAAPCRGPHRGRRLCAGGRVDTPQHQTGPRKGAVLPRRPGRGAQSAASRREPFLLPHLGILTSEELFDRVAAASVRQIPRNQLARQRGHSHSADETAVIELKSTSLKSRDSVIGPNDLFQLFQVGGPSQEGALSAETR